MVNIFVGEIILLLFRYHCNQDIERAIKEGDGIFIRAYKLLESKPKSRYIISYLVLRFFYKRLQIKVTDYMQEVINK